VVNSYMGIAYFMPEYPIEFNSKGFIFDTASENTENHQQGE
jgi:hypothetical protein